MCQPDRQSAPASRPLLTPELAAAWRARAADLAEFSRGSAAAFRRCADELEASLQVAALDDLTLAEAAQQSGYSVDHLARLVREGRIPNAGRRGKPMIRRSDLPVRPRKLDGPRVAAYDPVADARSLMSRRPYGGTCGEA